MKLTVSRKHIFIFLIIILMITAIFLWATPSPTAWLTGWKYREPLLIIEQSGQKLTNYQIRVELDEKVFDFSKCRPEGEDIRFVDGEENRLSFWIEKWPVESEADKQAIIWVKIPELSPYEKKTIYMYYGNSSVESYSNLTSTMDIIEVLKETIPSEISPENTWREIRFNNSKRIDAVINSPAGFSDDTPATVRLRKEADKWYATITESSLDDNVHQPEEVFFLGVPLGVFKLIDGTRIEIMKVDSKASDGPNILESERLSNVFYFNDEKSGNSVALSSLQTLDSANIQERLMQVVINRNTGISSFVSAHGEYDNTLPLSTTESVAIVRLSGNSSISKIYNSVTASYDYLEFFSVETTQSTVTIGFSVSSKTNTPIFILPHKDKGGYFPFARILESQKDLVALYFQSDPTAPEEIFEGNEHVLSFSIVRFSETGVFPVAKATFPEPEVYFDRVSGRVFEDSNSDGSAFESNDRARSGVSVRLYEDVNKNGIIDSEDVFCFETKTDHDGIYHLPARADRSYVVAVSAASIAESEKGKLNPGSIIYELLPEQTFVAEYKSGALIKKRVFGGNDPFVTDSWSSDTSPEKNIYEHTAIVEVDREEFISGVDFGFSYEVVTNSSDFKEKASRVQGSLRQVIINANALHGRQTLVFALSTSDPSYNKLTDEFVISPLEELPPVTDPLIIDGSQQRISSGSSLIVSGTNIPFENGLTLEAPFSEVRRVGFSGFQNGIYVAAYQYERPYSQESLDRARSQEFISLRSPEAALTRAFINRNIPGLIDFIPSKDDAGNSIYWVNSARTFPEVSYTYGGSLSFLSQREQIFPDSHSIVIPTTQKSLMAYVGTLKDGVKVLDGDRSYLVSSSQKIEFDVRDYAARIGSPSYFYAAPLPSSFSAVGGNSYKGQRFVTYLRKGDKFITTPPEEGVEININISHKLSDNSYKYETTVAPFVYQAEEDEVIILKSEAPLFAAKETSHGANVLLSPASQNLAAVVRDEFEVVALEDSAVDITLTAEDGNKISYSFNIQAGEKLSSRDMPVFKEALESGQYLAVEIRSSAPIAASTESPTGIETITRSSYSFTASEGLGIAAVLQADSEELAILSYGGSSAEIVEPDGSVHKVTMADSTGTINLSILRMNLPSGTIVKADSQIFVSFKNRWTGTVCVAQSNELDFDRSIAQVSPSPDIRAFDSDIIIDTCVFLANTNGIVVKSGNGVEITKTRFFSNSFSIDIGEDGRTENDGAFTIHQPNRGIDSPVVVSAILFENVLAVEGYVGLKENSEVFDGCSVEIYLADVSGQANMYLGSADVKDGKFELEMSAEGLSITSQDRVVAIATDNDGSTSEFSEPLRVDPAPVISNVKAIHILPASDTTPQPTVTTITWSTDIPSTSKVIYDVASRSSTETYSYETTESTELVTNHAVTITGLEINTVYYFRAISKNIDGDTTTSYEYVIPPGRMEADTDLCAYCHRAHTAVAPRLRLFYVRE